MGVGITPYFPDHRLSYTQAPHRARRIHVIAELGALPQDLNPRFLHHSAVPITFPQDYQSQMIQN